MKPIRNMDNSIRLDKRGYSIYSVRFKKYLREKVNLHKTMRLYLTAIKSFIKLITSPLQI